MKRALVITAAMGLALAGCSQAEPEPEVERSVVVAQEQLPEAEVEQSNLPFPFQELPTFTLDFDALPLAVDDVFVGLAERGSILEFSAADSTGAELWSTQRPASCSGYALSDVDGEPIVVLTDVETTKDALAGITASAYNARTGELKWGPVEVAGPWQGPGLIFAEAAPASAMGDVGPKQALDSTTGEVVAEDEEASIVGEYDGVVLTFDGELHAHGASDWSVPLESLVTNPDDLPSQPEVTAIPGVDAPSGFGLIRVDEGDTGAVVDLSTGAVVSTDASQAVWDAAAEVLVVVEHEALAGYTSDGPAWNRELADGLRIAASGGVLTYLRSDSSVQVINAVTGEDAVGYDPDTSNYAVPQLIMSDGAAVFSLDQLTLVGAHSQP